MLNIKEYFRPDSIGEAYRMLQSSGAVIIGGGAFLNLGERDIEAALDLSRLYLDYIEESSGQIEIGAMTTLRKIETSNLLRDNFSGVLSKAASFIMGVQVRNTATIGGTVYGKFGFSDLLTPLLALDSYVELYKEGSMRLERFLESKITKDILFKIIIKKSEMKASYLSIRNSCTDFPILNTAAALNGDKLRICIGARPSKAIAAYDAMNFINNTEVNEENAAVAGVIAAETMEFGSDIRASSAYRRELCRVLVKRCIMEVSQ